MKEKMNDLQDELKDSAQKIWMAGLGAVTMAGEEGTKLFKNLVEKGEAFQSQEHPPVDKMKQTANDAKEKVSDIWTKLEDGFNDKVAGALQKLGVPTKDEISQLTDRVDKLMEAINKLADVKTEEKAEEK